MEQKEIVTSIQIMNELIRRDFLKFKHINMNTDFFKKIINKKKLSKLNDALGSNENTMQTKINEYIYTSDDTTETTINDSIAVTNFTIPTSIYGDNSTAITNTNTNTNSNSNSNTNSNSKYKFSNSKSKSINTTVNSSVSI